MGQRRKLWLVRKSLKEAAWLRKTFKVTRKQVHERLVTEHANRLSTEVREPQ